MRPCARRCDFARHDNLTYQHTYQLDNNIQMGGATRSGVLPLCMVLCSLSFLGFFALVVDVMHFYGALIVVSSRVVCVQYPISKLVCTKSIFYHSEIQHRNHSIFKFDIGSGIEVL